MKVQTFSLALMAAALLASCAIRSPVAFGSSGDDDVSPFLTISGQQFSYRGSKVILRGVNINNEAALYLARDDYSEANGFANARVALAGRITEDERDYARLQSWGANVVRFGLDWHWFQGDTKATAYSTVDQHLAWAKAHGLWLIPTMFVPEGGDQDYSANLGFWGGLNSFSPTKMTPQMASLSQFWVEFASRYAAEPTIAGYDLLNEPSTTYVDDVWFPYALYLRDQIRSVDPNHFFVIEAGSTSTFSDRLPLGAGAKASDIVYSAHDYVPLSMTANPGSRYTYPGLAPDSDGTVRVWNKRTLDDQIRIQRRLPVEFGRSHNVPIFIGEFGSMKNTTGYVQYVSDSISLMNAWGISWAYFDYREGDPNQDLGLFNGPSPTPSSDVSPDTALIEAVRAGFGK